MRMRAMATLVLALCAASGCAQGPAKEGDAEKPEVTPELKRLVLEQAPTDIAHPLYVDFNGKAELLGYALDPESTAAPGSKLTLKLFWRSTGKLEAGYVPFTELLTPDGRRTEIEGSGPVRKGALAPQNWETSNVYIDELEISVPADINAARFAIVVGLKTQPIAPEEPIAPEADAKDAKKDEKKAEKPAEGTFGSVYLSVVSGPADGKHGAAIATVETGITPGAQRALAAKERGNVKRMPSGKLPVSAKPARPAQPQ